MTCNREVTTQNSYTASVFHTFPSLLTCVSTVSYKNKAFPIPSSRTDVTAIIPLRI